MVPSTCVDIWPTHKHCYLPSSTIFLFQNNAIVILEKGGGEEGNCVIMILEV